MSPDQVIALGGGEVVRHVPTGRAYNVVHNDGRSVHAVRAISVSNPSEWDLHDQPIGSIPVGQILLHLSGFSCVLVAPGLGAVVKNLSEAPEQWVLFSRPQRVPDDGNVPA